jgi:TonB family protein
MRVDRAVEKLRSLLERRGITSTAGALTAALAGQTVLAAPAGLAMTVTGTALAASGVATATFTFMSITKLQASLAAAVVALGGGIYAVQERTNAGLKAELNGIAPSAGDIARLQQANRELERTAGRARDLRVSDEELVRLRDEAVAVREKLQAAARPPVNSRKAPPPVSAVNIDQLDQKPKPTRMVGPVYPAEMAKAGITGKVTISFVIDSTGKVQQVQVMNSSRPEFEVAALMAATQWQFDPGRKSGRPVNARVTQVMEFNLANGGKDSSPATWF